MTATTRVERFLDELSRFEDPAVFISTADGDLLRALAADIDSRPDAEVPLRGLIFGVKDNIDVVGMATTAGCPAFSFEPAQSSSVVRKLVDAGAIPVAKTNLDQFATGLVGTRSPHGTPRNPFDPLHVPGGSSSGSAVAVANGIVDFALGTDTAGSGRVPAAFCGVIGVKPTPGRLSNAGVVPAVRALDCVSIFAPDLATAGAVLDIASGFDPVDPYSRPPGSGPSVGSVLRFGVLDAAGLAGAGADERTIEAYLAALDTLPQGRSTVIDFGPFAAAGDLLYGGSWVAGRTEAVGEFISAHRNDVDPTVGAIISAGAAYSAVDVHRCGLQLAGLRRQIDQVMDEIDVVVLPTTPHGATLADVAADPVGVNTALGRFTTFANLVDLAALSIPASAAGPGQVPFGITLYASAWGDQLLMSVASEMLGESMPGSALGSATVEVGAGRDELISLVVAGAHLRGQPLESQLTDLGAVWQETTQTKATYRLFALAGGPLKKPGVVFDPNGASIEVDVWGLSPAALGRFLTMVPAPLALGKVMLHDGRELTGFVCEPRALDGADDITESGGWRYHLGEPVPDR